MAYISEIVFPDNYLLISPCVISSQLFPFFLPGPFKQVLGLQTYDLTREICLVRKAEVICKLSWFVFPEPLNERHSEYTLLSPDLGSWRLIIMNCIPGLLLGFGYWEALA